VPALTPPGITLQLRASKDRSRPPEWLIANESGMALYRQTHAADCAQACAALWPAALAPPGSAADGAWSLITRTDGSQQWAYRGAALHLSTRDSVIGEAAADGAAGGLWVALTLQPDEGLDLPDDIDARELADAGGILLVTAQGLSLYESSACERGACAPGFHPLAAPAISSGIGEFSVRTRDDGVVQWLHRGLGLYTFDGDQKPTDVNGADLDPRLHLALIARAFMPGNVVLRRSPELGLILATRAGATLYQRDRVTPFEGHDFRVDRGSPSLGRQLGTASCDEHCAQTWLPLRAPTEALPSGYWAIATRTDGSRQWTYKGFALYTYARDQPGEVGGNGIYDLAPLEDRVAPNGTATAANSAASALAVPAGSTVVGIGVGAMFWHAVAP